MLFSQWSATRRRRGIGRTLTVLFLTRDTRDKGGAAVRVGVACARSVIGPVRSPPRLAWPPACARRRCSSEPIRCDRPQQPSPSSVRTLAISLRLSTQLHQALGPCGKGALY